MTKQIKQVSESTYLAAVEGRKEFRKAFKNARIELEKTKEVLRIGYETLNFIVLKAPSYDWNKDELNLTLKQGDFNALAEPLLK
jgi:hypothetical protein